MQERTVSNRNTIFNQIEAELRTRSVLQNVPISNDTELYRDLRIYGADVAEFIWWIDKKFGVQYVPEDWGPPEYPFLPFTQLFRRLIGCKERYYPSPKVGDIVDQIEQKTSP